MKHNGFILLLMILLLLSGCGFSEEPIPSTVPEESTVWIVTEPAATVPAATESLHTDLYHPDYTPEQVIAYFEEVVLDVEYSEGVGDVTLVQKWTSPIGFRTYGAPTETDLAVLNGLIMQLNRIPGFPGIYTAEAEGLENLWIGFLDRDAFEEGFSAVIHGEDAYGAAQFWYYTDTNEIHSARIGCRTDMDQTERDSVLVEEMINTLGLSDTVLREDSITYQFSNENTVLSDMDWILLNLLYHPDIQCGMDLEQCAAVIRRLYY